MIREPTAFLAVFAAWPRSRRARRSGALDGRILLRLLLLRGFGFVLRTLRSSSRSLRRRLGFAGSVGLARPSSPPPSSPRVARARVWSSPGWSRRQPPAASRSARARRPPTPRLGRAHGAAGGARERVRTLSRGTEVVATSRARHFLDGPYGDRAARSRSARFPGRRRVAAATCTRHVSRTRLARCRDGGAFFSAHAVALTGADGAPPWCCARRASTRRRAASRRRASPSATRAALAVGNLRRFSAARACVRGKDRARARAAARFGARGGGGGVARPGDASSPR